MDVDALNMEEESGDKKFLNRIMDVIKENYKNSYFEVSDFCEAAGVSKKPVEQKATKSCRAVCRTIHTQLPPEHCPRTITEKPGK